MDRIALEMLAKETANRFGVPPELVFGVIQTESAWRTDARSSAGAQGLMQLMPKTFVWLGYPIEKILDPATNIDAGTKYLSQLLAQYGGSWALAAMAYNGGPGTVNTAIARAKSKDPEAVSAKIYAAETRAYWTKVLNWAAYFAGKISQAQARAGAAAAIVSAEITSWAKSGTGMALILFIAAGAGYLLVRGIRG